MKWVFLINNASFFSEFLGKLSKEIINGGGECIVIFSGKITEQNKRNFFPKQLKFISYIDWCMSNYRNDRKDFFNLSWKEFFPLFLVRFGRTYLS